MIPWDVLGPRGAEYNNTFGQAHQNFEAFATFLTSHRAVAWARYEEDPYDMYENQLTYLAGDRCWHMVSPHEPNDGPGWRLQGVGGTVLWLPYKNIRDVIADTHQETFAVNVGGNWFDVTGLVFERSQQFKEHRCSRPATIYDERT